MATSDIKRRARTMVGPILGCLLVAYFVYHAVQGDHGALAWRQLDLRIAEARVSLDDLVGQRDFLEHRVGLLRPDSLDADMVEEQGRRLLNFTHPDDVIVIPGKK